MVLGVTKDTKHLVFGVKKDIGPGVNPLTAGAELSRFFT